ncbi:MAG: transposase [Candidatus Taylorbacteria bacterium]|nr:transposase [Candidatus Taylorbacteria bacterium]
MIRRFEFEISEWYHCFSKGVEGRKTFQDRGDYERFLSLIYLANSVKSVNLFSQRNFSFSDALNVDRGKSIVTVGAYCLMPTHYHLVLREDTEGGISKFMQKLGTGYAMYFNLKNERIGNLFVRPFRARYLDKDEYFQHVIKYVHFNPSELYEPRWREGKVKDLKTLQQKILNYPYSSLNCYEDKSSLIRKLIGESVFSVYRKEPISGMLNDARKYYEECKSML